MRARPGSVRSPLLAAILLATLLCAIGAGCDREAAPEAARTRPEPPRGRVLFAQACAPCHGSRGRGDGPMGATLAATDLTRPEVQPRLTEAYVGDRVRRGGPRMPPVPGLTDAEIADVTHYLRSLPN